MADARRLPGVNGVTNLIVVRPAGREEAARQAWAVPGVVSVENQIRIAY